MERVYNFAAGPSMLPLEVLEEAQKELLNFNGTGMSVTEISHRAKPFMAVVEEAEAKEKAKLLEEENRKKREEALLTEIRDLLKSMNK